jgi:O-succinylhomoserine sulfhydrylase
MSIPARPAGRRLRLDTLAVREGLPRTPWGENSEALFLTSCFVHPDAATAARRFANEEDAFVYSRFSNPNVTIMERRLAALEGTTAASAPPAAWGHPAAGHGPAEGRRPRGVLAERVRLDDQAAAGVRQVRRRDHLRRQTDVGAVARGDAAQHRLLFAETPTNPLTEVCDIPRWPTSPTRPARCWRWTTACARRRCSSR